MKPKRKKIKAGKTSHSRGRRTRAADAPLEWEAARTILDVEPLGVGDGSNAAIAAAAIDPDVEVSEGGD